MQLEQLTDEALVGRIRDGDQAALQALSVRLAARWEGRIGRRLAPGIRRKVAVSDILQEASIVAVERVADFQDRGDGSFARWFARIVELKIKEAVRRYAGTQRRDVGREITERRLPISHAVAATTPTPSQMMAGEELKDAVRRALNQLPEDHRRVLRLLQDEGRTMDQAARAMDRSKEATRKLYARALLRLKQLLDRETREP
jgi:RNA polymerase sigma-70 factor (subfamily 1)